jgi:hypothetical protein
MDTRRPGGGAGTAPTLTPNFQPYRLRPLRAPCEIASVGSVHSGPANYLRTADSQGAPAVANRVVLAQAGCFEVSSLELWNLAFGIDLSNDAQLAAGQQHRPECRLAQAAGVDTDGSIELVRHVTARRDPP